MKLYQISFKQFNKISKIINNLYNEKIISLNEKIKLTRLFELMLYGDIKNANILLVGYDQYLSYQAEKIVEKLN
ncbi:hypothetical protein J6TS2_05840 [Heyndrickxia sporothermodurans]|nr:hypothetical protein J6TS2_05840 [Heyndrickxia sporothermodurans]